MVWFLGSARPSGTNRFPRTKGPTCEFKVYLLHDDATECRCLHACFNVHFRDLQEKTDCPDILDREERL